MSARVHIEYRQNVNYPEWNEKSCYGLGADNEVYKMVQDTLVALGMDKENPFADFISPGDTVLVKPNMVRHENGDKEEGTDCLVTHPSVVRAVLDYVVRALGQSGRIILADAPVQGCDFGQLVEKLHYDKLTAHYKAQGINVELMDLRQLDAAYAKEDSARFTGKNRDIVVNMGADSAFMEKQSGQDEAPDYRITNYLPEHMENFHKGEKHDYSLAGVVLQADVIINLPKPKTHRKAGMTASLKNMIGCVAKKECLPHHTKGSKQEHGDEYLQSSLFKRWRTGLTEADDRLVAKGKKKSKLIALTQIFLWKASKMKKTDTYTEGSWYGNDTLWRTICDMCRSVLYADKNGQLREEPQRKMFVLADMIVAGEGEGPLCPKAKKKGMLVGGFEQIAVDEVIAALMGYDAKRFPSIANADFGRRYRLPKHTPDISSNDEGVTGKTLVEIREKADPFVPTAGWAEYLGGKKD